VRKYVDQWNVGGGGMQIQKISGGGSSNLSAAERSAQGSTLHYINVVKINLNLHCIADYCQTTKRV